MAAFNNVTLNKQPMGCDSQLATPGERKFNCSSRTRYMTDLVFGY